MPRAPRRRLPPSLLLALTLPAAPAFAEARFTSQVPGLDITALADLPPAPATQGDREACRHKLVSAPATPAGESVLAGAGASRPNCPSVR